MIFRAKMVYTDGEVKNLNTDDANEVLRFWLSVAHDTEARGKRIERFEAEYNGFISQYPKEEKQIPC